MEQLRKNRSKSHWLHRYQTTMHLWKIIPTHTAITLLSIALTVTATNGYTAKPTEYPATPVSGWWDFGYYTFRASMLPTGTGRIGDWHIRWPGHEDMYNDPKACSHPGELLFIRCTITSCGGYFTCRRDYQCPDGTTLTAQAGEPPICIGTPEQQEEKEPPDCPTAGNPINAISGNKYQKELDYLGTGPFPLIFERHYNSRKFITPGRMGLKWRHTYEKSVQVLNVAGNAVARVYRPNGRILTHRWDTTVGAWQADLDVVEELQELTDQQGSRTGWRYTTGNNWIEEYDAQGRLITISNDQGLTQTLAYNVDELLESVTGPLRQTISLAYEKSSSDGSYRLVTITDPAGTQYDYQYDVEGHLIGLAFPGDTPNDATDNPKRVYHYENSAFPNALTGITDENGDRFASWSYDVQGRAITSEHAGGVEKFSISYIHVKDSADPQVTVTNALGKQTTYHFTTIHGVRKVTQVEGHSTASCAGANKAYTYDANGFLASKTNWNGTVTSYTRDNRGLELSRIEATGTPETRTITTEWHSQYRLPLTITEPDKVIDFTYDAKGQLLSRQERSVPKTAGTSR